MKMINKSKSNAGSVLVTVGTSIVVLAIAVSALGAGGYSYMGVNPDAVYLVAGCALFGVTLTACGIMFMVSGLSSGIRSLAEQLDEIGSRIDRLETENEHLSHVEGIIHAHQSERVERDFETKIRDVINLIEERNRQLNIRIDDTGREISGFQKVIEARPARRVDSSV
jgi:hypothetical protein